MAIIDKIKVSNMVSEKGNTIANQYEIVTPEGIYFQSYDTVIAFLPKNSGKVILDEDSWDYSKTTGKYRNIFLGEDKKATQKKIDSGYYLLEDLN